MIMPIAMLQKRKTISMGSFMAALKRTMDSAPTMPRESTTFELITIITVAVITHISTKDALKDWLYITPL